MADVPSPDVLGNLFQDAKEEDEFEFVSTLLRIKGMRDAGWDSLDESWSLINDLSSLINAPLESQTVMRLMLFLYCHVTEMDALYAVTANLLRVLHGDRCLIAPFAPEAGSERGEARYPHQKVERITELADGTGHEDVAHLLEWILVRRVRNAFYHSDYVLFGDEFRIIRGPGVDIGNTITKAVKLEWLVPRMERAINTVLRLLHEVQDHRASYTESKIIEGRFTPDGSYGHVELMVEEGVGLVGFRTPPIDDDN